MDGAFAMRFLFVIFGVGVFVAFGVSQFRQQPPNEHGVAQNVELAPLQEHSMQAVLRDTAGDFPAGAATQKLLGDDFIVLIDARLPSPGGFKYFAWLVRRAEETEVVPLGELKSDPDEPNWWKAEFRSASPFLDYPEVWVTREEQPDDDVPEVMVLKGKWQ